MKANRKYSVAVALLAVLAVVFGLAGTVAPMSLSVSPQQSSSSSVTHFMNPPTYDSDWVNITEKCGQSFNITHDLNTTEVFVDIVGKQSLNGIGGEHQRNIGGTFIVPGWNKAYGGSGTDYGFSLVQTSDGGYALGGYTNSFGAVGTDGWLVKTDVENGLAWVSLTNYTITFYRGKTDPYWNYLRVRIWIIKEPTWQFGDINQDGVVDAEDLAIIGRNYGKTFSALSLGGIAAVAGIYACKKRKQPK